MTYSKTESFGCAHFRSLSEDLEDHLFVDHFIIKKCKQLHRKSKTLRGF